MSTGSRFSLQVNSGFQDQLLNANELLEKRIAQIIADNNAKTNTYSEEELVALPEKGATAYLNIEDSILPSLARLEQTHMVFVSNTFKPYVNTTYEYTKQPMPAPRFGQTLDYVLSMGNGNFINDMVLHVKITGLRAKDPRDRVRFVAFPGHRFITNSQFLINNGHIIDERGTEDYNAYYQYELETEAKKRAWCRNMGQEVPKVAFLTSDPSVDMYREYRMIGDGFQTLKYSHDSLEMFIPLLFWCKDIKNAIPAHILPWGRAQIRIQLANLADLIGFADYGGGGGYVEPKIEFCNLYTNNVSIPDVVYSIFAKKYVFNIMRTNRTQRKLLREYGTQRILLNNIKYPVEQMFFAFRPCANINFSQHWYRNAKLTEKTVKVPVVAKNQSAVLTGTVVTATTTTAVITAVGLSGVDSYYNGYDFVITGGRGYNNLDITKNRYVVTAYSGIASRITIAGWTGQIPDATTTFELYLPQLATNTMSYWEESPVVSSIALSCNDIKLYQDNPELFYNSYLSLRYSGKMAPPEDRGSYLINFSQYPLHDQPSGVFNSSVGRELYLEYTSDIITRDSPAELILISRVINFLIVKNGTMALRFT
jgi:hypothetical protein